MYIIFDQDCSVKETDQKYMDYLKKFKCHFSGFQHFIQRLPQHTLGQEGSMAQYKYV